MAEKGESLQELDFSDLNTPAIVGALGGQKTNEDVIVHPLVLLSVVDHYTRVAKDSKKRVVGVLLGSKRRNGTVDITNSFAVPFEEDLNNPSVWFLDHNYLDSMYWMFRKVNSTFWMIKNIPIVS